MTMVRECAPASLTRRSCLLGAALGFLSPLSWGSDVAAPALMLANAYRADIDLQAYWVSEKYDGIRGFWNGQQLLTRGGSVVQAPVWFTAGWPQHPMDGELWAGRGQFERTVSTVRSLKPNDQAWHEITFMVFDLPAHTGTFDERLPEIQKAVDRIGHPWVQAVVQSRVGHSGALQRRLEDTVNAGGEGLMLHRGDSLYRSVRNDDLLKLKLHEDADAQVIGHLPGQGRYRDMLGALRVRTPDGREFRLGSGLSDALRRSPPPVGTWVSYRFRGFHNSGLPRFATFLRVRKDAGLHGLQESTAKPDHSHR